MNGRIVAVAQFVFARVTTIEEVYPMSSSLYLPFFFLESLAPYYFLSKERDYWS
jgi:hypothetical protein